MMQYTRLGSSGLQVSRLALGCMELGNVQKQPWHLNEEEGLAYIQGALARGINFFDTADVYGQGESERILGKALAKYANRNEVVVATIVYYPLDQSLNGGGLSRKHIMAALDASLERLQMDYVDLYIIHRWDYQTPIEETMACLNDLVKSGKVHYIGASAMYAWQFQKAQYIAKHNGWTPFISMQNHYNLLYREDEREMIPLCQDLGVALTPYSPLAGGRLARDWFADTKRSQLDQSAKDKYDANEPVDHEIVNRVGELAKQKGVTRAQIALSYLLGHPQVAAPIIGGSRLTHLDDAIGALDIVLTPDERAYLEEAYQPHRIVGAL